MRRAIGPHFRLGMRRSVRMRFLFSSALVLVAATWFAFSPAAPDWIIYNPSSSMPVGFYLRAWHSAPGVGEIVTVRARDVAAQYAAMRGFADESDRFLKRVAAGEGDVVCAVGESVRVNGAEVARRARYDTQGRTLPTWKGCARLHGRYLLLGDGADSFDGRYWGLVDGALIEAAWRPIGPQAGASACACSRQERSRCQTHGEG
jgi:type IV secretory pathway protease TraF